MAAHRKPEESDWVEGSAREGPPSYQQACPESSTDALLREMLNKMNLMDSRMEKMTTELKHVKFTMARDFIMDIIRTKEFAKSIATCVDTDGKLNSDKFMKMVESAEPGGLAALIGELMVEYKLTNDELKGVLLTYEPSPELKHKWSAMKKGFVWTMGAGWVLLALVALLASAALGGALVAGGAAAVCGLVCAGGVVLMK